MEELTPNEYERLEGVRMPHDLRAEVRESTPRDLEVALAFACKACHYDVDADGYCQFCGETTLPH